MASGVGRTHLSSVMSASTLSGVSSSVAAAPAMRREEHNKPLRSFILTVRSYGTGGTTIEISSMLGAPAAPYIPRRQYAFTDGDQATHAIKTPAWRAKNKLPRSPQRGSSSMRQPSLSGPGAETAGRSANHVWAGSSSATPNIKLIGDAERLSRIAASLFVVSADVDDEWLGSGLFARSRRWACAMPGRPRALVTNKSSR